MAKSEQQQLDEIKKAEVRREKQRKRKQEGRRAILILLLVTTLLSLGLYLKSRWSGGVELSWPRINLRLGQIGGSERITFEK